MIEQGALGKKIVFLYPPPVLTEVVEELARREFEVYLVKDHIRLRRVLAAHPESIVFINIDAELDEASWASYVRELRADERTAGVGVGIISLNADEELAKKYLMDIGVPCGFIVLKIGAAKTVEILEKTLEANEARGRRKFVRASCPPGAAQAAAELDGVQLRGEVSDLSAAGAAISFEGEHDLRPGTVIRGLQLSLKGVRLSVDGFIAARREGAERPIHVVMFSPSSLDETKREKLKTTVFKINQAAMDRLIETA